MNNWNKAPFIRLLIPFILGIIVAVYFPLFIKHTSIIVSILFFIISLIVLTPRLYLPYRNLWVYGVLIYSTLFFLGVQLTTLKTEIYTANHFSKMLHDHTLVHCKIIEPIVEKENSIKTIIEIEGVYINKKYYSSRGKAVVYLKKTPKSLGLQFGDELISKSFFQELSPPKNPGEFNYKTFLSFHNINYQCYYVDKNWVFTNKNSANSILKNALILRNYLLAILSNNHIEGDEYAVGSALLLGYEDKLDAEIISAYSSTGALHVLSVSGLHVGIVFIVFNWLLFFFDKFKYGNIIKAILLLFLLWFYATLTGLSPSVLRSATMFSFIIVAKGLKRNTNIYNTLALSAFFLLLINPYLIMDVGFQLSYLAVFGIVYIQPKIYNRFEFTNKITDSIWAISSVSIAAQIATFPLGLHYFHQFPNYFLFSNLIVIPLSTVVIYFGLSIFVFAKFSIIIVYLSLAFSSIVWLLNYIVKWMEHLPYAIIQGISISVFETWLIYAIIICFLIYFANRKFSILITALSLTIVVFFYQVIQQDKEYTQQQLIVYNVPKTSAIDFISGKENVLLTDSLFAFDESKLLFHIKHNWWDLGIDKSNIISTNFKNNFVCINNDFIQFNSKRIKIIKDESIEYTPFDVIHLDYLILSNNPRISIKDIFKKHKVKKIIFDSSNSKQKVKSWIIACKQMNIDYFDVSERGAFVLNF